MKKVDLFPAILLIAPENSLPDYTLLEMSGPNQPQDTRKQDSARVAIKDSVIYVAKDSPDGPLLVFREQIIEYSLDPITHTHHALSSSGKILAFNRDNNCGCGSRLRGWSPFGASLSAQNDPEGP